MSKPKQHAEIQLPTSAEVARRIYSNASENRLLRSLHRVLVQLENTGKATSKDVGLEEGATQMLTPNEIQQIAKAVAMELQQSPVSESLLDSHQAASLLGCSVPTIGD